LASVLSILILLISSAGVARASGGGGNGLPGGIVGGATPYYPYIAPASSYPTPDAAVAAQTGSNVTLPQLGATGTGSTPTYFLLYDAASDDLMGVPPHDFLEWRSHLDIREGTFSPWLATDILTGQGTTRTIPINWSSPYSITAIPGNCSATALSVASTGTAIVAGISCGSSSYVYLSTAATALTSWALIASPSGRQLRLALDPDGQVLATTILNGDAYANVIPFPSGTIVTTSLTVATQASPVIVRTVTGDIFGVATVDNPWGVSFFSESTGGWGGEALKVFHPSNTSKIFPSIGNTFLGNPGGTPNQISAAVVGQSIVVLFTALDNGTTVAEVTSSATEGIYWNAPQVLPPTEGSVSDPELVGSADGYVYATWLATAGQNQSTIEQAVFASDGRILSPATPVPGGTGPWTKVNNETVGLALDSLMRPLFVWLAPDGTVGNSLEETGAFLSPGQIVAQFTPALENLNSNDMAAGTLSTYENGVSGLLSGVSTNASQASSSTHLNAARNLTAALYQNVSLTGLSYFGEIQIPIEFHHVVIGYYYLFAGGANLSRAVETGGSWPVADTFGSLVQSAGFGSATTFLQVQADWLFSSEGVEPTGPSTPFGNLTLPANFEQLPNYGYQGVASTTVDGLESQATITPLVVNPTTLQLSSSGSFATYSETVNLGPKVCNNEYYTNTTVNTTKPTAFNDTPALGITNYATIKSSSFIPALYLQNVSADTDLQWALTLEGSYSEWNNWTTYSGCTATHGHQYLGYHPTYGPSTVSMLTGASIATTLTTQETVDEVGSSQVNVVWDNSMLADGTANLTPALGHGSLSGFVSTYTQDFTALALTYGHTYGAVVNTSSRMGGYVSSPAEPSSSAGEQTSAPAQAFQTECQFVYQPNNVRSWNVGAKGGGNSTASVTWFSNAVGVGTLVYSEAGTAVNLTAGATVTNDSNGTYTYTAEVHGLPGGAFYTIEGTTSVTAGGCLNLLGITSSSAFLGQGFSIQPIAYAYDSITQSGGGEGIRIYLAPGLYSQYQGALATFSGGSMTYGPANLSGPNVTIPIPSLTNITCGGDCYLENITPSAPNASYVVQSVLNFTWEHVTYSVDSSPTSFFYLQDTTGDGLTDAEKLAGWTVTYTSANGVVHNELETCAPTLYSTNGLVGDYVEKEYGLNPNTIDTAGSHMLDTWNLTFNLGSHYPLSYPGDILVWNETSSYNPFAPTVQYSPGLFESGKAQNSSPNVSSISPTPLGGITSGDGSPAAATELYSQAALDQLWVLILNENVGWLRGVLGKYHQFYTLTVWGKLSWGDDPLVASAPEDGIADGARVNPLHTVGLDVIDLNASQTNLATGAGYAVQLQPENSTTGAYQYTNYSAQALVGNATIPTISDYSTVLPIPQTSQYSLLNLEMYYRAQGGGLIPLPINGSSWIVDFNYDLVGGRFVKAFTVTGTNGSTGPKAALTINLQTVALGVKVPTFLWLPTTNSTINGLPVGLKRYTGEQSFDLIVVNATSSYTSDSISLPWGGTYKITLQSGVNEILVPREQFFTSSFGESLLQGKALPYNSSGPTPPLLGLSGVQSLITPFDGSNLYVDLAAYWQNRAIGTGTAGNFSNEGGTSKTSTNSVDVVAVSNPPANNTGGLPSNPGLLNSSNANAPTAAIQGVITLNVTSKSMLDVLAAGLLDNSTNGVNGTLASITSQVPFLGFDSAVTAGLINAVPITDGLCGAPQSQYPPPPPPSSGLWGDFVNAVSSVVLTVAGAIVSLVSVVYTAAVAAADFVTHLAREAADVGGQLLARAAATLVSIGDLILKSLSELLSWLWTEISSFVTKAASGLASQVTGSLRSWAADFYSATNETVGAFQGVSGDSSRAVNDFSGDLLPLFLIAAAVTIALTIIIGLTAPFSVGIGTVLGFIVPIIFELLNLAGSLSGAPGWLTGLDSYLSSSISGLIQGTDWVIEALMNASGVLSMTAVTNFFVPSFHGDYFLFGALITTGTAWGFNTVLQAALTGLKPEDPAKLGYGGQAAESQQDAALAALFGIFAVLAVAGEGLLALQAAGHGSSSYVRMGEVTMAGLAMILGGVSLLYGYYSVANMPADEEIDGADELSDAAMLTGFMGEALGAADGASIV
jgi:hypothetical protein